MTIDPVCGRTVEPEKAAAYVVYRGTTFYFCSSACHHAFAACPGVYGVGGGPQGADVDDKVYGGQAPPARQFSR